MCFLIISHLKVQISSTPLHTASALLHVFLFTLKFLFLVEIEDDNLTFTFKLGRFFFRDAAFLNCIYEHMLLLLLFSLLPQVFVNIIDIVVVIHVQNCLLLLVFVFTSFIIFKRMINEFVYIFVYVFAHACRYVRK